jgi:RNA polymerase sigma-70 factor (ECF subfamily)
MSTESNHPQSALTSAEFDAFYDRALPIVYGYLLRLCGGNSDDAWDLTQDTWTALIVRLADGETEKATVGYLLTIARSRFLDGWRRQDRLQRKLRLVWATDREAPTEEPSKGDVLEHIASCAPAHRAVLMLTYIDDLPVADVAQLVGASLSTTYSTLERARAELRRHIDGDPS